MNQNMIQKLGTLFLTLITIEICHGQCGKDEYRRCVMLADPLLKDAQLIYPDNLRDVDRVCRTWSQFVDCVKRYTDLCFTENKRREFNKAVANPVDLVHQMCTSQAYQIEYLKHAPCMRATLTDDSHCGRHYRHLVSQVSGEPATPALCCSHFRFRECLLDQTQRTCNKEAYPFAQQILDKAMGFLQDQCSSYTPDQIDCPGADFYTGSGNKMTQTWSDLSTARMTPDRVTSDRITPDRITPDRSKTWPDEHRNTMRKYDWMTQTWTASSPESQPSLIDNTLGNPRTAHSRGMSWNPSTDPVSWRVSGGLQTDPSWTQHVKVSTTTSNMLIDEPNQQGLSNQNSAHIPKLNQFLFLIPLLLLLRGPY